MTFEHPDSVGDELPPGVTLCNGQYTIERYLSAGGFGVTYIARDSLGRQVVIKECFPSAMCFRDMKTVCVRSQGKAVEFDTILELFEKEAMALAALQHPYIVGVHQFFRDNGTAYMAMDYVEGRTLLDIIKSDPARLTPDFVRTLLTRILEALTYIHQHDILHRDISPDNIIVDDDNLPVLIDFGAAREDASRVSRVLSKVLTVKDGYSPPEFYLAGNKQGYASDLYALAATFYHVLTRNAPADSNARLAAAARDAGDPLDAMGALDGFEAAFLDALRACLSLFPKDRLQSAEAWLNAIDRDKHQQHLLKRAETDHSIEVVVAKVVKDFFVDFQPLDPSEQAKAKPARAPEPKRQTTRILSFTSLDDPDEDDDTPSVEDTAPYRPEPREPTLAPIEKMRAKYAKPPPPEEEEDDPEPATQSGWFSRLSLNPNIDRQG